METRYEIYKMKRAEGDYLPDEKKLKYEQEADNKGSTIYDFSKWVHSERTETLIVMSLMIFLMLIMFLLGMLQGISAVI